MLTRCEPLLAPSSPQGQFRYTGVAQSPDKRHNPSQTTQKSAVGGSKTKRGVYRELFRRIPKNPTSALQGAIASRSPSVKFGAPSLDPQLPSSRIRGAERQEEARIGAFPKNLDPGTNCVRPNITYRICLCSNGVKVEVPDTKVGHFNSSKT